MPEDLRLRIGAFVATIPLIGTPAQIAAALQDFFEEQDISQEGTEEERMTRLLAYLQRHILIIARARRRKKKEAVNIAAIDTEIDNEISF